jgi:hypothetical protein
MKIVRVLKTMCLSITMLCLSITMLASAFVAFYFIATMLRVVLYKLCIYS